MIMSRRVCLDAGHGGKDPGALGQNNEKEKDYNLRAALTIGNILSSKNVGIEVVYTRTTDAFFELTERANIANKANAELFVSVHLNSADNNAATGTETYHYSNSENGKNFAACIQSGLDNLGIFKSRGVKSNTFTVLAKTNMTAILIELCFINNPSDVNILNKNFTKVCEEIASGIIKQLGISETPKTPLTEICGKPQATAEQMAGYLLSKNPAPKILCMAQELAELFIEEGKTENIRGDIAWCQSLKETGYFKFGNIVNPEQNNYAGIGALNDNANGQCAVFSTPREGVRAQIQHLKAYANTDSLKNACVDPRFSKVKRGASPYVEWLGAADNPNGAGWAVPGNEYGESILKILAEVMNFKVEIKPENIFADASQPKLEQWQRDGLDILLKDGLIADEAYWLSGNATKPDVVGLFGKIYKKLLK